MGDYHSYSNILSLDEDRSNLSLSALNLLTGTRHVDCCIYTYIRNKSFILRHLSTYLSELLLCLTNLCSYEHTHKQTTRKEAHYV